MSTWLLRAFGLLLMLTALAVPLSRAPERDVQTLVARWAPRPSDFIDLAGQLVHYRDEGPRHDPAPLLLLHDRAGSLHTWEPWVRGLRGTRRVISMDLPGAGLTGPSAQGDYGAAALVPFVLSLADRLQLRHFVVIGHGFGGSLAWQLAAQAPQRVQRVVVLGASVAPTADPTLLLRLMATPGLRWLAGHLLPRGVITDSLKHQWGDPTRVTSTLVDRHFELLLRDGNRAALTRALQQDAAQASAWPPLSQPVLLLWGGRDRLQPVARAQALARRQPGSRLQVFDALGHVPQEEDPVATLKALQEFVAPPR